MPNVPISLPQYLSIRRMLCLDRQAIIPCIITPSNPQAAQIRRVPDIVHAKEETNGKPSENAPGSFQTSPHPAS